MQQLGDLPHAPDHSLICGEGHAMHVSQSNSNPELCRDTDTPSSHSFAVNRDGQSAVESQPPRSPTTLTTTSLLPPLPTPTYDTSADFFAGTLYLSAPIAEKQLPLPLDLVVVLDASLCSRKRADSRRNRFLDPSGFSYLDIAKHALSSISACLGPLSRVALVRCARGLARLTCPLVPAGSSLFDDALCVCRSQGQSAIGDGLKIANDLLRISDDKHTNRAILLVMFHTEEIPIMPNNSVATLDCVCVEKCHAPNEMQTLCSQSGGGFYHAPSPMDLQGVINTAACDILHARWNRLMLHTPEGDTVRLGRWNSETPRRRAMVLHRPPSFATVSCMRGSTYSEWNVRITPSDQELPSAQDTAGLIESLHLLSTAEGFEAAERLLFNTIFDTLRVQNISAAVSKFVASIMFDAVSTDLDFEGWGRAAAVAVAEAVRMDTAGRRRGKEWRLTWSAMNQDFLSGRFVARPTYVLDVLPDAVPVEPMEPEKFMVSAWRTVVSGVMCMCCRATPIRRHPSLPARTEEIENRSVGMFRRFQTAQHEPRHGAACLAASTRVQTAGGVWKPICEVRTGDMLTCRPGVTAQVRAVVVQHGYCGQLWRVDNDLFTSHHPVLLLLPNGEPSHFLAAKDLPRCELVPYTCPISLFNLVLSEGHTVMTAAGAAVTLGHRFQSNEAVTHPFFGSNKVVQQLRERPEWGVTGAVIRIKGVTRDPFNTLVDGFLFY